MSSAVEMKRVVGIIPIELQESIVQGEINIKEFLRDLVNYHNAQTKSTENITNDFKRKSITEELKEKIENKKFENVRNKMVTSALGISLDDLKNYKKDAERIIEGEYAPSEAESDIVRDRRRVWRGQVGSNKRDKKNILIGTATGVASVALDSFPILASVLAAIPGLQQVLIGVSLVSLLRAVVAYAKGRKGNVADGIEKERAYLEALGPYMEKIKALEDAIASDKDLILEKKKTLSRKEFSKWYTEYAENLKEKLSQDKKDEVSIQ